MHLSKSITTAVICLVALTACEKKDPSPAVEPPKAAASSAPAVLAPDALQAWVGRWNGPEGTYLKLVAKPDSKYQITIMDLDGEKTYEGVGRVDRITFERDGIPEQIKATDGEATGMKWLADMKNCLTIKEGEGYCRD